MIPLCPRNHPSHVLLSGRVRAAGGQLFIQAERVVWIQEISMDQHDQETGIVSSDVAG
jgi:hypothetical protein